MSEIPTRAELADMASEAIRALNHATFVPGDLPVPDAYRVVGGLSEMTARLPQLLEQLSRNLQARVELDGLRLDSYGVQRYTSPGAAIGIAQLSLAEAITAARTLATSLDEVLEVVATIADTYGPSNQLREEGDQDDDEV